MDYFESGTYYLMRLLTPTVKLCIVSYCIVSTALVQTKKKDFGKKKQAYIPAAISRKLDRGKVLWVLEYIYMIGFDLITSFSKMEQTHRTMIDCNECCSNGEFHF